MIENARDKFAEMLVWANPNDAHRILEWLDATDFFSAPASTMYHDNLPGGLVEHSIRVARLAKAKYEMFEKIGCKFSDDSTIQSVVFCALLHDVCKVGVYKTDFRNQKNEDGKWERVPYIKFEDPLPLGHGEKSAMLLSRFAQLTDSEMAMIRWHMGNEVSIYGRSDGFAQACDKWPEVCILHTSDLEASFVMASKAVAE